MDDFGNAPDDLGQFAPAEDTNQEDDEEDFQLGGQYQEDIDPDIVATVASLGSLEGEKYVKAPECSICIVDLIKFLRLEDGKIANVRRQIARTKTVDKDIIPILVTYEDDIELLEDLIRLLVNLTMPAILCFKDPPKKKDATFSAMNLEVNIYLRQYKASFVRLNAMRVFSMHIGRLLQIGSNNRTDEDDLFLERLLIITRNLLHVPSDSSEDDEFQGSLTTHDRLILSMVEFGVDDLLLFLCGSQEEQQHCLLALEILYLMLRDFDSKTIALHDSRSCSGEVDNELKELREKEIATKTKHDKYKASRHSRFGGTFVVKGMKSITDNDLIYHKNLKKFEKFSFDDEKARVRHVGHKRVIGDEIAKRSSTPQMRSTLQNLCKKFLDVCYNPLMKKVKGLLCRKTGEDNDETYYLWACQFFMEFNRTPKFHIELVAETLSIDSFSYILQLIFRFNESIKTLSAKEAKQLMEMSKRLHNAVKAYQEMLNNLHLMVISKDTKITDIANVIQNNIFYQQEYRELPPMLLKEFNRKNQSRSYLRDLIECTHTYVRMLDAYSISKPLIIQETKKAAKKKGKKTKKKKNMLSEEEMKEMWEGDIERDVIGIMSSGSVTTSNVQPFDASKEYTMDQQRILCKHNIQDLLKSGATAEGVALYRAAREVWPASPSFGMSDMSIIDEVEVMKSIFLSRDEIPTFDDEPDHAGGHEVNAEMMETPVMHSVKERTFQSSEYLMMFARPNIMSAYCYLLSYFEDNSSITNHAALKMVYRQATKNGMVSMLFQVTFFRTLMRIMHAPKIAAYKDLQKFAAFVVRKFTEALKSSPMLSMDALFWKTPNDVLLIDNNYDEDKMPNRITAVEWSPQEEVELRMLFEKYIERARELDMCQMISEDLQAEDKDRMAVKKQILKLEICDASNKWALKKPKQAQKKQWLPDEHEALRKLYDEYKYERDPVALIQEKLDTKSKKNIIAELNGLLGVRGKDLDVNRVIWTADDDEELRILYEHLSEENTGEALLEAISDKIPKNRLKNEIKDALIRLKLQRNEHSKDHFWTKEERSVLNNHSNLSNKKHMMDKLIPLLPNVSRNDIIQELMSQNLLSPEERTSLIMDYGSDNEESSDEEEEEEEEEFDFFEIPKLLMCLQSTHKEGIVWVCGLIENAIKSREEDLDYDTVFIVPRSDSHSDSLDSKEFCHMLKCLGAIPPLSGHENYWKITSAISDNILRKGGAMLSGEAVYSESESESAAVTNRVESSSEDDGDIDNFFSKMRSKSPVKVKKAKAPKILDDMEESPDSSPAPVTIALSPNTVPNQPLTATIANRSRQFSDSDEDQLPGLMIDEDESDKENTHSKRPRGSTFVDSDSGGSDNGSVVRNSQKKARPRLIMSDSE